MLSREEKLEIGRAYLKQKKARGGIGNNQFMQNSASTGNTAELIAGEYGISPASVKNFARIAQQEAFNASVQAYFDKARSRANVQPNDHSIYNYRVI